MLHPPQKNDESVFFPPAPQLPRVQYLGSFSGLKDVEEESAFDKFVLGEKPNLKLDKPYGVGIYDGKIYVCDTNNTVAVFDLKGKKFVPLEGAKGPGKLVQPLNISIEEDGTKYVTDPVRGQVIMFDKDDKYVRAYGEPDKKWKPTDAHAFEDRLYVVDEKNGVVKVFNKQTGEMVKTIGDKGPVEQKLHMPTNAVFDKQGNLYVSDAGKFAVLKFDRDGHFLATIGKIGDSMGNFARPRGVAVDLEGNVYVADAAFNNVQIFNKEGRLLMFFGSRETGVHPGALILPARVAIDYKNLKYFEKYIDPSFQAEHLVIVTSQFGKRLVNVFAVGKQKGAKYPTDEDIRKLLEEKKKKELEELQKNQPKKEGDQPPDQDGEGTTEPQERSDVPEKK